MTEDWLNGLVLLSVHRDLNLNSDNLLHKICKDASSTTQVFV